MQPTDAPSDATAPLGAASHGAAPQPTASVARATPATTDDTSSNHTSSNPTRSIVVTAAIGGAVALSLGVYGRTHAPTGERIFDFGFPTLIDMKAWFATAAVVLALVQLTTAAMMWGRLPEFGLRGSAIAAIHRWTGTTAFLLTLPVAYHCLWALGFQDTTTRVLVHSFLGCCFYGAISTKLLLLRARNLPPKVLPFVGGALVVLLTGIWLTSSLWFFTTYSGARP